MDINALASQIVVVVLFFVPGSVYLWTYERLVGRLTLTGTERLLRAVTMSAVVYAFFSAWLARLVALGIEENLNVQEGIAAAFVLVLAAPFALGVVVAQVRRRELSIRWLGWLTSIHPAPSAWDFAFEGTSRAFLRIKLRDGTMIGGAYGKRSFASSYPEPPSVFIEQAWRLGERGEFMEPMEGNLGIYVGLDDVQSVEWVEVRHDGEEVSQ